MSQRKLDVIVIGGGISGLSAAKLLREQGQSVLVLEARDRVGGRTHTIKDPAFQYLDVGGTYIGPTQNRILRVAKELGVKNQMVNDKERAINFRNGKSYAFHGPLPTSTSFFGLLDTNNALRLIDKYGEEIPAAAPWDAPRAIEWDSMTVQSWLDANCWCRVTKEIITVVSRAALATEPSDVSFLFFLWYIKVGAGLTRFMGTSDGGQERKFVGGSMQISEGLAAKLGEEASYMISAVPVALLGMISFQPGLPSLKSQMIQRMPMGSVIKTFVFYKTSFWRKLDYNGAIMGTEGPIVFTLEESKPDGSHPAIIGFVNGEKARQLCLLTEEERKKTICEYYAKAFGTEEALHPINYVEKNWMDEEFSGGCYMAAAPPGVFTQFGRVLREPFGRIYFAGTETASHWSGYMEGAVQAGERAAREILYQKGLIAKDEIWQDEPESLDIPAKPLHQSTLEKLLPSVSGFLRFFSTVTTLTALGAAVYFHKDRIQQLLTRK